MKETRAIELLGQLLVCIRGASRPEDAVSLCDDVVGACIRSCNNVELHEPLIKLLTSDVNKIDAYIMAGKLKAAYLLAVKLERVVDVKRIMAAAQRNEQESVRKICSMWIQRKEQEHA